MDGGLTLTWLIVLLVIISLQKSRWVSAKEGFISIDCGIATGSNYTDRETEIYYTSDAEFIDTGFNYNVSMEYFHEYTDQHLMNVRSFPEGDKNCYTLRPGQGKNHKYLIRARFMYGNYDSKNQPPIFKLYLGVDEWVTVNITDSESIFRKEIIHIPITDDIDVCLVNTDSGTPFISVLELRQLNDSIYSTTEPGSLLLYNRWDFGTQEVSGVIRDKDDVYDRIWIPFTSPSWESIDSSLVSSSFSSSDYKLPGSVMATAATPAYEGESWGISLSIDDDDPSQKLYMYMHFAEVEDLEGQIREFTISVNDDESWYGPLAPRYLFPDTIYSKYSMSSSTGNQLSFSLTSTSRSTLPPIINAMEAYFIKEFSQSSTQQNDVDAIKKIKSDYAVSRNWQGDPCLPMKYQWDGLTCNHNTSPTIISLNLSSSNLSGNILPSFSSLKSLQNLDLSYNNLTGTVPNFFADLPSLTILNLRGNNLTGSVPQAVMDKFKDGSFGENPNLCLSVSCQGKKKKNKFFVPVLVSILSAAVILILIAALAIIRKLTKRRETKATTIETVTECPKEGSLKSGNSEFTFSDVISFTNNFSRAIGRGGFGQVYLGILADGTQVAVKVRSQSSMQGPKALRAETKLLSRVHHKNLVRLIGYCKDGTNMALIYEYMSNGNLQQKLSGREADVLNWEQRLQIAVDAAQGLEYLHNGCKPPIVHRDMKSSNILLTETLQARIADFGMSRDLPTESGAWMSTVTAGTPGYLDPEYQSTGNLNKKSDVYSFGIVLLELITGRPAIKNPGSIHIIRWVRPMIERGDIRSIVDPKLQGDFNTNSAWKVVEIALACVAPTGMQRPDMGHVLVDLKECLEIEVASRRIQSEVSHSIGSGNFQEESPLVLSTEMAPHAR